MNPSPYDHCLLCPRRCGVNRSAGERGYCGEAAELRLASASIHRGEEPPVTGRGGSGTIFVTGCNLGCVFCQNYQLSNGGRLSGGMGRAVSPEEFAGLCLALRDRGAENVNIVTGSHAVPALRRGIDAARAGGLGIPVLWNSSAYETPGTLELLRDAVDVYLPDLKTLDRGVAAKFFNAPDYPDQAPAAIERMMDYRPLAYKPGGGEPVLASGVIIRHLILPGCLDSTWQVLRWFARRARGRALLSLMTQYTPVAGVPGRGGAPGRFLTGEEDETVLRWLDEFGIEEGFYQELRAGDEWLPDFRRKNPFSSDLSVPIWHWKEGCGGPGLDRGLSL